eukprot:TRINITY_DN10357_c0_g1_i1.p1 TRINITY_DN10357_c0_g1~~TRINITY_DN10357_c0_g1_i1.p1  ORF type:complete len:1546 (+),score=483.21 TRINITY_DN10357_c0_g1_i1:52-4689(+)
MRGRWGPAAAAAAACALPAVGQRPNLPSAAGDLRVPQLLATHGGYSFFKVWIDPSAVQWEPKHPVTDDVVAAVCKQARGEGALGAPPGAPCPSSDASCRYTSLGRCAGTAEAGCESPMLTTALAMGCRAADDPACRDRVVAALAGTNFGCLWSHRGLRWAGRGACGVCRCNDDQWPGSPTRRLSAGAGASCDAMRAVCQWGSRYSTDGTVWAGCAPDVNGSCVGPSTGAPWPDSPMEHWAFCVGRGVCRCAHGSCDIASESGACVTGTCHASWHGPNCDQPCDASSCLGRNDPAARPPAGVVPSTANGVWTTAGSQCHCECLAQYAPSGVGGYGVACGACAQPRQGQCTPLQMRTLASPTVPTEVYAGEDFMVEVTAMDELGQVDQSLTNTLVVAKEPGGGNSGGGDLVVKTSNSQMTLGRLVLTLQFSRGCAACYLYVREKDSALRPLRHGPWRVLARATHMKAATSVSEVAVGGAVRVVLLAMDGAVGGVGAVAERSPSVPRAALQLTPSGGNGGGCSIRPEAPSASLTQPFAAGAAEFRFSFSCACDACVVVFEDARGLLPPLSLPPIRVLTGARRLGCRVPDGSACGPGPIRLQRRVGLLNVSIEALDAAGNRDVTSAAVVRVAKQGAAGGELLNFGGARALTQQLTAGSAPFQLSFSKACFPCVLSATHVGSAPAPLERYVFPDIIVWSTAIALSVAGVTPAQVNVGEEFVVVTQAVDDAANLDTSWAGEVNATILPHGGNGGGGVLRDREAPAGVVRFVNGTYSWRLRFSQACTVCIVQFSDLSGVLSSVQLPPIAVLTRRVRLALRDPMPEEVEVSIPFVLRVQAVDADGNTDFSDTGTVALKLRPGGGNGDGGVLYDEKGLRREMVAGAARLDPAFSRACTACYIEVTHGDDIPTLVLGSVLVRSPATRLVFLVPPPPTARRGIPFAVTAQAVDDHGSVDPAPRGRFRLAKVREELGLGSDGGLLSNAGVVSRLQQPMLEGAVSWEPEFSQGCRPCFLDVVDESGALPTLRSDAIIVTTNALRLWAASPWAAAAPGTVAKRVAVREPYEVRVIAVDDNFDRDHAAQVAVTASLEPDGGNGGGGPLLSVPEGQLTRWTEHGEARFMLRHPRACAACVLRFEAGTGLRPVELPPVQVVTEGERLAVTAPPPSVVRRGEAFLLMVSVVDARGDSAAEWRSPIAVRLLPGGSNGGGGELLNANGTAGLEQYPAGGSASFLLSLTAACVGCLLEVRDPRGGGMAPVVAGPVEVTTETARLVMEAGGGLEDPAAAVRVALRVVDTEGNANTADSSLVGVRYARVSSDGAVVQEFALQGGEERPLRSGRADFTLAVGSGCPDCQLIATYSPREGGSPSLYRDRGVPARLPVTGRAGAPPPAPLDPRAVNISAAPGAESDSGSDVALGVGVAAALCCVLAALAAVVGYTFCRKGRAPPEEQPDPSAKGSDSSARGKRSASESAERLTDTLTSWGADPAARRAAAAARVVGARRGRQATRLSAVSDNALLDEAAASADLSAASTFEWPPSDLPWMRRTPALRGTTG